MAGHQPRGVRIDVDAFGMAGSPGRGSGDIGGDTDSLILRTYVCVSCMQGRRGVGMLPQGRGVEASSSHPTGLS